MGILLPWQVRRRIGRILLHDVEPHSDSEKINWFLAHKITELYRADYQRCLDICQMLLDDEKELKIKIPSPKKRWWQRSRHG